MDNLYSIMSLDTDHIDEICEDIRYKYENGIASCVLFMMKLVPEGNPAIDKAAIDCEKYKLFKDRLAEMGLECGVLVQCSIGHGQPLNQMFSFQPLLGLKDGKISNVCCPYDEGFREYIKQQMATIARMSPKMIMLDDDFRLISYRSGKGCACELHMKEFNRLAGTNLTQEELWDIISGDTDKCEEYTNLFIETQRDSLLGAARAMREGIDSVDPKIPGSFCVVGAAAEFGGEIAKILAGEGNPAVVRINNGAYTQPGARELAPGAYRAAQQIEVLKKDADIILAETDTCPQNRYSTGAYTLHSHFTSSILEGVMGAKHWITRLIDYEPESGEAYRKILGKYSKFYDELYKLVPKLNWFGCRIPLATKVDYGFKTSFYYDLWSVNVLERMGFPIYYSSQNGGVTFLEDATVKRFTDAELREMLKGTLVLTGGAARYLNEHGYGEFIGVEVKDWSGAAMSFERLFVNGRKCARQKNSLEIIPKNKAVESHSMVMHLKDGKDEIPLFPGVVSYKNSLGGTVITFAGTVDFQFSYTEAFGFLNESRKKQMAQLFNFPIYHNNDAEVYMKAAKMEDGGAFAAVFNIGLDPIEEITFKISDEYKSVNRVEMLCPDGKKAQCEFSIIEDVLTVKAPAYTRNPVILFIY